MHIGHVNSRLVQARFGDTVRLGVEVVRKAWSGSRAQRPATCAIYAIVLAYVEFIGDSNLKDLCPSSWLHRSSIQDCSQKSVLIVDHIHVRYTFLSMFCLLKEARLHAQFGILNRLPIRDRSATFRDKLNSILRRFG